jgi:hypothetical protein
MRGRRQGTGRKRTFSFFRRSSSISAMSSTSRTSFTWRSKSFWCGSTSGPSSALMLKTFRRAQISKKSNESSTCVSRSVWSDTSPCSISSAAVQLRGPWRAVQASRYSCIAFTVASAASAATFQMSSSRYWGSKPRTSGSRISAPVPEAPARLGGAASLGAAEGPAADAGMVDEEAQAT